MILHFLDDFALDKQEHLKLDFFFTQNILESSDRRFILRGYLRRTGFETEKEIIKIAVITTSIRSSFDQIKESQVLQDALHEW
jgi:hypothetical protein